MVGTQATPTPSPAGYEDFNVKGYENEIREKVRIVKFYALWYNYAYSDGTFKIFTGTPFMNTVNGKYVLLFNVTVSSPLFVCI